MGDQENRSKFKLTISDIRNGLVDNLRKISKYAATTDEFYKLDTDAERISFVDDLLEKYELFPEFVGQDKDDGLGAKYRQEGNDAYRLKNYFAACKLYTKSIAHAKTNGECLGLAYANRSAVLYEKKMYTQCLEDITKAFEHNYPKKLHDKLTQRQNQARRFLSTQSTFKYYETAASLSRPNKTIQCASASVEIGKSEVSGRQVVALDRIKVGDVIAVEKPYACALSKEYLYSHCSFCLKLCYNMLPCENCVCAMFCSTQCREAAWTQYHRYECPILGNLYGLNIHDSSVIALRIAIMAKEHYRKIDSNAVKLNDTYKSERYEEIYFLETNSHLRTKNGLFTMAIIAAVLRNIMTKGSSFHRHLDDPERDAAIFAELIMRHLQSSATNFHAIQEYVEEERRLGKPAIGTGAYAFLSLFNHSCCTNVARTYHGTEIVVRALKPIAKGDEVLDDYGCNFGTWEKDDRQQKLRENYFFDCACEACENNWPLYEYMEGAPITSDILKPLQLVFPKSPAEVMVMDGRKKAAILVKRFLKEYNQLSKDVFHSHKQFIYEMEEMLETYYSRMGNKRPEF